ncbi:MAG: hypothetical protein LN588_01360 [Rickettsia endosymbiont of Bryobia graminum]|nr:hypothetical protein [Rickettsia endosymbiont of Bryobia graminum]
MTFVYIFAHSSILRRKRRGIYPKESERSTGQAPWYLCRPKGRVQAALALYLPAPDVLYTV